MPLYRSSNRDGDAILQFTGEYFFLSNFWIEPDGSCVEREFQQAKCADPEDSLKFRWLEPGQCKRLGREVKLRSDWEEVKLSIMAELTAKKFRDHPGLCEKLLATSHYDLIHGNYHGDQFWGVDLKNGGYGMNHLGEILMTVREVLS